MDDIKIAIGSWGSYNECNERALGSKWLDLSDYTDWDEIVDELKQEGFQLDGIDEELFIQDVDGIPSSCTNWDYTHPKELFEILLESDILTDSYKNLIFSSYLEVRTFDEFCGLVEKHGNRWDDDINLYQGYSWEDYGREIFDSCCYQIEESLLDYFDFESYGRSMGLDYATEYSGGIIEICR